MGKSTPTVMTQLAKRVVADDAPRTLGDLLDRADFDLVPESEWVEAVNAIAERDQAALRNLYERSHRIVFTLILRITHNRQSAEEVMLDVYHEVWRRASGYDAINGSVLGWILNQARSRAIDRVRHDRCQKRVNPFPNDPVLVVIDPPIEALAANETAVRLRAAVASLDQDERAALEAAFFSDLTHVEIASRFKEPLGTIKSRIRSGLRKLRRNLAPDKEAR